MRNTNNALQQLDISSISGAREQPQATASPNVPAERHNAHAAEGSAVIGDDDDEREENSGTGGTTAFTFTARLFLLYHHHNPLLRSHIYVCPCLRLFRLHLSNNRSKSGQ